MKPLQKLLAGALALTLAVSVSSTAASTVGLDNFQKVNTYASGKFSDVDAGSWYFDNVKAAYELGLMLGQGTTFGVDSDVTIGETVALAARLHSIYSGDGQVFQQGTPWYQVYVDYVKEKNLIDLSGFDMTAYATRAQYAAILAAALPDEALESVSNIADNAIPDVKVGDAWAEPIYKLYRAGILTGTDSSGTYQPDAKIKRNEVAAIVTRMADTSLRKTITLGDFHTVTFNLNYSDASNQTVTVESGKTVPAPADPTRNGYTFDGWYTSETGGAKYDFGSKVATDVTLYARWTAVSTGRSRSGGSLPLLYVTFNSNGDSQNFKKIVECGKCVVKPIDPIKEGYRFSGWYVDTEFTTEYDFTAAVTHNLTLYAKWDFALDLRTDCDFVIIGDDTAVGFYVQSYLSIPHGAVLDLCEVVDDGYVVVAKLYDDGQYAAHGDDIAGDAIYSGRLSTAPTEDSVKSFFAAYGEIRSNEVKVEYKLPLSDEDWAAVDIAHEKISALVSSPDFKQATDEEKRVAVEAILDELAKSDFIDASSVKYGELSGIFSFRFKSGISGFVQTRKSNHLFNELLETNGETA